MKSAPQILALLWTISPIGMLSVVAQQITISERHPQYWELDGVPVLLLGGSSEDNLFQIEDLEAELDLLVSVGGNYVRNTMSSRDSGNEWPFYRQPNKRYDLNRWNAEYWQRFEHLLRATAARGIVVQIEVWATFDFYREPWLENPFNPANNDNYSAERSELLEEISTHPIYRDNDFFRAIPTQLGNPIVLGYQQRFVDKILSYTLGYSHVLYCIDNETSVNADWGRFWANYIHEAARDQNKEVEVTEMWDPWNLDHVLHRETFDHPELYGFVEFSQNNHMVGQAHWDAALTQIERLKRRGILRPANNVKIYGNDGGQHKTTRDAIESFFRNVLVGAASARFHRPESGQGLGANAQAAIRSMREIERSLPNFFDAVPRNDLLRERSDNEAYCRADRGNAYLVYFPNNGDVTLDLSGSAGTFELRWLDLMKTVWTEPVIAQSQKSIRLQSPGEGHWAASLRRVSQ